MSLIDTSCFLKALSHQSGVLKNIADRRAARCAVASNVVLALYNGLERHVAAIMLDMHKNNAADWCLHSALLDFLEHRGRVVGALPIRCGDAV